MAADEPEAYDVFISHKSILPIKALTADLKLKLVTQTGEFNMLTEFEEITHPKKKTRLRAKLDLSKELIFKLVQDF